MCILCAIPEKFGIDNDCIRIIAVTVIIMCLLNNCLEQITLQMVA